MLNPILDSIILSHEEYKIYARQTILNNIGSNGQKRLKKAKILFIGAGGLGCPAILYLAASGIGCLGIIDQDIVSISNLHRQILYKQENINELKTLSVKKAIKKINPYCQINIYSEKFTTNNAHQLIKTYDLILDTSDNFSTRYLIDYICNKLHKIHIYGGVERFEGQISVFNYKNGPKYSDLYPRYLKLYENNCNNIGILGILPGIVGILQATEAIKIILGIGKILSGSLLVYNALNMSFKKIKINSIKIKEKINYNNEIQTLDQNNIINITDLNFKIKNNEKISIIDVRQKIEFQINHIKNSINIPLPHIEMKRNQDLICKLMNKTTIVIYCSHNSRSIIASRILDRHKIKHYRLINGLNISK